MSMAEMMHDGAMMMLASKPCHFCGEPAVAVRNVNANAASSAPSQNVPVCRRHSTYNRRFVELPHGFPTIVCLCGSTRFGDAYRAAQRDETFAGKIVLTVGLLGHLEGIDMTGPVKAALDELHLRKIDLADEVLILNVGGYIGDSTRRELEYARRLDKTVRFLEPHFTA